MSDFEVEIRPSVSLRRFCQKSREAANNARQSAQFQFRVQRRKDRATSGTGVASDYYQTLCGYVVVARFDSVTCQRGRDTRFRPAIFDSLHGAPYCFGRAV